MNRGSDWGRMLKEEDPVNQLMMSDKQKDQVIAQAKLTKVSFWNKEIRIPIPLAAAVVGLSFILILTPVYNVLTFDGAVPNHSSTAGDDLDESYVEIDGMLIQKQLLVRGERP